jgi:glycosyltransferase involved in cell wall biosynthesis
MDASNDDRTCDFCRELIPGLKAVLRWVRAETRGAAAKRNEAFRASEQPWVLFMDDDVILEPESIAPLWSAVQANDRLGGVNTLITNQCYQAPGRVGGWVLQVLNRGPSATFAGRWVGGILNMLAGDNPEAGDVIPVEWLNLGCTLYRREGLPDPPLLLGSPATPSGRISRFLWK